MFCSDVTDEASGTGPGLTALDSALQELGMLSTITASRNQYLQELRRKSFGSKPNFCPRKDLPSPSHAGIIHMNTRYVSNVTIGLRMKRATNNRMIPYSVPERNRTKSENSEGLHSDTRLEHPLSQDTWMEYSSSCASVLDPKLGSAPSTIRLPLKKARSLEDIRVENIHASQPSHEMEFVSSRIQKLKVME